MKLRSLLVLLLGATGGWAQVTTGIQFDGYSIPETLAGVPWLRVTNYAEENGRANLGVGVSYRGRDFKVDLYVYDALEPQWTDPQVVIPAPKTPVLNACLTAFCFQQCVLMRASLGMT